MTVKEIESMLREMGVDYKYHHFSEEEAIDPPFLVWIFPESDDFMADGVRYKEISKLDIELYTDSKDFELEKRIETVLERHGLTAKRTEGYLESEQLYEELYEMEVIVNEQN